MAKLTASERLERARAALVFDQPFFASLALRFPWRESTEIPTMATDGRTYFFNPKFVESLSLDETAGVMAHEVMHNVLFHVLRMKDRDDHPMLGNIAADFVVNPLVRDAGRQFGSIKLPDGALLDPKFEGWTYEQVYDHLKKNVQEQPQSGGDNVHGASGHDWAEQGCGGVLEPGPDGEGRRPSKVEREEMRAEMESAIAQAAQVAKSQGKLPSSIESYVDDLVKPHVDPWEAIRHYVSTVNQDDFSWRRFSRRFLAGGTYLPSLYHESLGTVVVAIDTSGSMSQDEIRIAGSHLKLILEDYAPAEIIVIYCDSEIQHVDRYDQADAFSLGSRFARYGQGGTLVAPPFEYIDAEGIEPDVMIYFSDMCFSDCPPFAPCPVLWGATDKHGADGTPPPLGRVVDVSDSLRTAP